MAVLFTVLLGISAAVLGYFSYYFNRGHYIQGAGVVIDTELTYMAAAHDAGQLEETLSWASKRDGRAYRYSRPDRSLIAGNLDSLPAHINVLTEGIILLPYQGRDYAAKIHTFADGRTLLAGVDITEAAASYRLMQWLSMLSIGLMAIVILVSFLISTFVVSRTNSIAMTAKDMMDTGDLSRRIEIDARWDDLGNMAFVLNAFLAKVESLMLGIRRVSDNIAHDLRTPLTRLLNNLETLRVTECVEKDTAAAEMCDSMIAETNRLLTTFNALLRIARVETGDLRQYFTPLNLDPVVADVIDLYEPLAEEKGITLTADIRPISYTGDRDLLFQAFANLLDNAIKFTPSGGIVSITLGMADGRPHFSIRDNGPGIEDADKAKIFDRFYRTDASRGSEGNGLGLSLVAAVFDLHNADISVRDNAPGAVFEVIF